MIRARSNREVLWPDWYEYSKSRRLQKPPISVCSLCYDRQLSPHSGGIACLYSYIVASVNANIAPTIRFLISQNASRNRATSC